MKCGRLNRPQNLQLKKKPAEILKCRQIGQFFLMEFQDLQTERAKRFVNLKLNICCG